MANKEIAATTELTGVKNRLNALEPKVTTLETDSAAHALSITTLTGRADSVDGTLSAYDTRLDALEAGGGGAGGIGDGSLTLAKLVNTSQNTFLMRYSSGSGPWQAATPAQAVAALPTFAANAKGLVPAAGATPDATKFLNEAGAFAVPAGGGGGVTTYTPELASGAVARNIADALAEIIDFRSTGGTMENDNADMAKVNTLFGGAIPGQRVFGRRGGGTGGVLKLTSTLVITRHIDIDLDRAFDIRLDSTGAANAVEYSPNYGIGEYAAGTSPNADGDFRNTILRGGRIYINGAGNTGTALVINKSGSGHKSGVLTLLEDMQLTGGGGALLIDSTRTDIFSQDKETQWFVGRRLDLTNGVTVRAEDGTVFVDSMSSGKNGTLWQKTFGAFNWGWHRGAIVNYGINIDIEDGSHGQFENIQLEHSVSGLTGPEAAATVKEAFVRVRGLNYPAQGNSFRNLNIGGSQYAQHLAKLERARRTRFDGCQWGGASAAGHADGNSDLLLTVGTGAVANDTSGTILEPNQTFRGARNVLGFGVLTDASRRMVIKTTGSRKFRTAQYGIRFPGFQHLASPTAGFEDADLEFYITADGLVIPSGGVRRPTGNGGLALNTSPGKLPTWMLPYQSTFIPVWTRKSAGVAWILVFRNGDGSPDTTNANLGLIELQNNWPTEEYLYFGQWQAVVEPDYVTVN
jgi:hypothetical protein